MLRKPSRCHLFIFALAVCVFAFHDSKAQNASVTNVRISSVWAGLSSKPFPRSDITLQRSGDRFVSRGWSVPASHVEALLNAVQEPPISQPDPKNLGIDNVWLNAHIREAIDGLWSIRFEEGSEDQKQLFRSALTDPALLSGHLTRLYSLDHTDDYPYLEFWLTLADGRVLDIRSASQNPYMLPWNQGTEDHPKETYNTDISNALLALLPPKFANRERLTNSGLAGSLGAVVGMQIESKWKLLGAEHGAGPALKELEKHYEVKNAEINPYHDLAFGKSWEEKGRHEENLHVTLRRNTFPKSFSTTAILLKGANGVEGAEALPTRAKPYEDLALSIPWLKEHFLQHPSDLAWLFYVHDVSFSPKAMRNFSADMKAGKHADILARVASEEPHAALLKTGFGNYLIILPDGWTVI